MLTHSRIVLNQEGRYASTVKANFDLARSIGLTVTPAFVIVTESNILNVIEGYQTIESFRNQLDSSLSQGEK
jgi:protein-disulfide isomerase